MNKATELLEKAAITFEKYKKNKTLVSPEDLAGKYKAPFEKLKRQLADELSAYLKAYSMGALEFTQDDQGFLASFAEDVNRIYEDSGAGKKIGRAVFKELNLETVKKIAEELRIRVYNEAWIPYFQKHICLYATEECLTDNPQTPRVYNSLVDKFWSEEDKTWIKDDSERQQALLIYIQRRETA